MVEEDVRVSCVLAESGRLERCHMGRATAALGERIAEVLARRRYGPVRYRGEPISVCYDFLIRLLPVSPRAMEARTAAFRWAAHHMAPGNDVIVKRCFAPGPEPAEPSPAGLTALRLPGSTGPASTCERREDVGYIHLRAFDLRGDTGEGEVSLTIPGAGG